MSVCVVVPVRDQLAQTKKLAACLAAQTQPPARVICLDDGSASATRSWVAKQPGWEREDVDGMTIYQAWSYGYWRAERGGADDVLVVNNDVVLPPHALEWLSAALSQDELRAATYPDFAAPWSEKPAKLPRRALEVALTHGVWGSGGLTGFCFMLRASRVSWRPLVQDQTYQWWFGDNAIAESIERAKLQQAKVLGLPVRHEHEATASGYDLRVVKERDAQLWASRRQTRAFRVGARGTRNVSRRDWRATRPPRPGA